jgi:hypothetical protein
MVWRNEDKNLHIPAVLVQKRAKRVVNKIVQIKNSLAF